MATSLSAPQAKIALRLYSAGDSVRLGTLTLRALYVVTKRNVPEDHYGSEGQHEKRIQPSISDYDIGFKRPGTWLF